MGFDTGYRITEDELMRTRTTDNTDILIICPYCGTENYIVLNWHGAIQGLLFCWKCGKEI